MNLHASYGEAFARFASLRPPDERALREQAFAAFSASGFPDRKIERWHYTDLTRLAQFGVALPARDAGIDTDALRFADCDSALFIDGRRADGAAQGAPQITAVETHAGLAGLHAAFAQAGLDWQIEAASAPEKPLHLLSVSSGREAGALSALTHRVALARHARAVVIVEHVGLPGESRLITQTLDLDLAEGAELTVLRLQREAAQTTQWLHTEARLARDARLKLVNLDLGGGLIRNDWRIHLDAPGAVAEFHGLAAAEARAHVDNQVEVEHAAAHGSSRQTFRNLGFERSRTVLNDRVVVRPGAVKTDSEQHVASLLLSPSAEVDAKPELEIYADDVKCAHGNSCGQLDEQAVFYLRTRGVPQALARALLTVSFVSPVLHEISHEGLRQRVIGSLAPRLDTDAENFA